MPINVRFNRRGFYHPAFGRMGRGSNAGKVYSLPDAFAVTGMLPFDAEIIDDPQLLETALEEEGQRKPIKPKLVDEVQLAKTEKAASARKPKATRPKASEE
jgi:hypothetical protein